MRPRLAGQAAGRRDALDAQFLLVECMISAPLVGAIPAAAGWRLSTVPHPDRKTTGSQAGIMPTTHSPQPLLTSTFTLPFGIIRHSA